ncbi:hypothetical protein DVA81_18625, partial [Acinetobacter baumannii]
CAPCQTRTQPAVSPSLPGAFGQNEWLGKEMDRQKHTLSHKWTQVGGQADTVYKISHRNKQE